MAKAQESALHCPLGDTLPAPCPCTTLELAPGVRWLRMALPFALDDINLWPLRDVQDGMQGWTIVDCGVANAATKALWEQIFASQLQGLPVLRVIVSHMHPDHTGLAQRLADRWSSAERECRLCISATDRNAARLASQGISGRLQGPGAAARHQAKRQTGLPLPAAAPGLPARPTLLFTALIL